MRRLTGDHWTAILVLAPSIILLAIFVYGFIGQTAYASMTDWGDPSKPGLGATTNLEFRGLEKYDTLFNSALQYRFRVDIVNTIFFTLLFLAGCLGTGLLMALLLDQRIRGEGIFRTIFLFPMSLSFVVTGVVWRWLFTQNGGLNTLPTVFGLPRANYNWFIDNNQILRFSWVDMMRVVVGLGIAALIYYAVRSMRRKQSYKGIITGVIGLSLLGWFLGEGLPNISRVSKAEMHGFNIALVSIVIAATWQMAGYTMAMYLAGLRGIAEEQREAARVDGCNEIQIYRLVVLPQLAPITLSATIILGHISLKIFDLVFVIARENNLRVDLPGINMYLTSFQSNRFALGAAIAMIMLIMVAVVIVPYLVNTFRGEARS